MEAALQTNHAHAVARPLSVLVPLIKNDLAHAKEATSRAGMPYYRAIGEKLIEARDGSHMTYKELLAWSQRNFKLGRTQTQIYIQLADDALPHERVA